MGDERFSLSREEIGLLLSYATRPDRMTEELIERLVSGVTGPELIEICTTVGLPESTPTRIVQAQASPAGGTRAPLINGRFRRATVTLLVVMVIVNVGFAAAAGFSGVRLVLASLGGVAVGYLLYRVITIIGSFGRSRDDLA